jgi:DNA-directed RNA polymerase subunit omega
VIEALLSDEIVDKFGGRFKLTALIQKRLQELIEGARPLVDRHGRSDLEIVVAEIMEEKITLDWDACGLERPAQLFWAGILPLCLGSTLFILFYVIMDGSGAQAMAAG